MSRKYLALDIETTKVTPANGRDWRLHRPLGISCAATLSGDSDEPLVWHGGINRKRPASRMNRKELRELVGYLARQVDGGYTIVTWNGVGFDFDIMAEESGILQKCRRLAVSHVDMMFHLLCQVGYGIGLESAAKGMDLAGKRGGMTGAVAPRLWAEGKRKEVLEYVAQDVRITLQLAQICEGRGFVRWMTRSGRKRELPLPKGWLPVDVAERLPQPYTLWMGDQWSRARFTAWLRSGA